VSDEELAAVVDYMNTHHVDDLLLYVAKWTDIGKAIDNANGFSQGSMGLEREGTELLSVSPEGVLKVRAAVRKTKFFSNKDTFSEEICFIDIREVIRTTDAAGKAAPPKYDPALSARQAKEKAEAELKDRGPCSADELKRALMTLSRRCGRTEATGNMMLMPVGEFAGVLPDDLWLNDVPNKIETRQYFYDQAVAAVEAALTDRDKDSVVSRMQMTVLTPELNPSMDSYRVGTLLEMVRDIATRLACSGLRVRVCVQGPMGRGIFVGLPLSLNGVRKILEMMDWQADKGQPLEGMIADDGKPERFVRFGAIGEDQVDKDKRSPKDDVFILICPQNIIGFSILDDLREMVAAADGRPMLLINPKLDDIQSSEGKMNVRGRAERIAFAASFREIYHYDTLYPRPGVYFPVVGAVSRAAYREPYVVFARREEVAKGASASRRRSVAELNRARDEGLLTEFHQPLGSFDERPTADQVNDLFKKAGAQYAENTKDEWKGDSKAKAPAKHPEWLAAEDESGETYYWNTATREVSWENPEDEAGG